MGKTRLAMSSRRNRRGHPRHIRSRIGNEPVILRPCCRNLVRRVQGHRRRYNRDWPAAEEMLYLAMEDFRVDLWSAGPGATASPWISHRSAGREQRPRSDRWTGRCATVLVSQRPMEFYSPRNRPDHQAFVGHSGCVWTCAMDARVEDRRRSRGTPAGSDKHACCAGGPGHTPRFAAAGAVTGHRDTRRLDVYDSWDEMGLDGGPSRARSLVKSFGGDRMGCRSTLAVSVGEEADDRGWKEVCETYLVRAGYWPVRQGPGARRCWRHLGLAGAAARHRRATIGLFDDHE